MISSNFHLMFLAADLVMVYEVLEGSKFQVTTGWLEELGLG